MARIVHLYQYPLLLNNWETFMCSHWEGGDKQAVWSKSMHESIGKQHQMFAINNIKCQLFGCTSLLYKHDLDKQTGNHPLLCWVVSFSIVFFPTILLFCKQPVLRNRQHCYLKQRLKKQAVFIFKFLIIFFFISSTLSLIPSVHITATAVSAIKVNNLTYHCFTTL